MSEKNEETKQMRQRLSMSPHSISGTEDVTLEAHKAFWEELLEFFTNTRNGCLLGLWFIWLFVGTIFYSYYLEIGWSKGFYMSVNVGYSVGWGDIAEPYAGGQIFSTIYVICGASFVGAALGIFGEMAVSNHKNWYEEAQKAMFIKKELEKHANAFNQAYYWVLANIELLRPILLWWLIVIICIISACVINDWDFATGLYFAVSSLSTGGLVALPPDSDNAYYGLLGLYAAFGIPLMALAMGTLAGFFIASPSGNLELIMKQVQEEVTEEELEMLGSFKLDLDDDKDSLNKGEFLILAMVRIGAASPDLIQTINAYFDELDVDGSKSLDIDELKKKKVIENVDYDDGNKSTNKNAVEAMMRHFERKAVKTMNRRFSPPSSQSGHVGGIQADKTDKDQVDAMAQL